MMKYKDFYAGFSSLYVSSSLTRSFCKELKEEGTITEEQYCKFMDAAYILHKDLTNIVRKRMNELFIESTS